MHKGVFLLEGLTAKIDSGKAGAVGTQQLTIERTERSNFCQNSGSLIFCRFVIVEEIFRELTKVTKPQLRFKTSNL